MRTSLRPILALLFVTPVAAATAQIGSCEADFTWSANALNPLDVQFQFTGYTPPGSFSFLGTWDFGDGWGSNDSLPSHTYSTPGTYDVCLTFSICIGGGISCFDDTCMHVTIGAPSSVQEIAAISSLEAWPNPATTDVNIDVVCSGEGVIEAVLLDPAGREVSRNTHVPVPGMNHLSIPVAGLKPGQYLVRVQAGAAILTKAIHVE